MKKVKSHALSLVLATALLPVASAANQPDWETQVEHAVRQNSKAIQFSVRCGYPKDILGALARYDAALLGAAAKQGTPTTVSLNAIKEDVRARMQTPPREVCASSLDLMRQRGREAVAAAQQIQALTQPAK